MPFACLLLIRVLSGALKKNKNLSQTLLCAECLNLSPLATKVWQIHFAVWTEKFGQICLTKFWNWLSESFSTWADCNPIKSRKLCPRTPPTHCSYHSYKHLEEHAQGVLVSLSDKAFPLLYLIWSSSSWIAPHTTLYFCTMLGILRCPSFKIHWVHGQGSRSFQLGAIRIWYESNATIWGDAY